MVASSSGGSPCITSFSGLSNDSALAAEEVRVSLAFLVLATTVQTSSEKNEA